MGVTVGRVFAVVMAALGACGVAVALIMVGQRLRRILRGHTALATVVDYEHDRDTEGKPLYTPIVDFVTRDGRRHTQGGVEGPTGSHAADRPAGPYHVPP